MMSYKLCVSGKRAFAGVYVEYGDKNIYYRGTSKTNGGNSEDNLFEFINMYLELLPVEKLDQHWEYLKQAKRIIEPGYFDEPESEEVVMLRKNNLDYKFLCAKIYPILENIYKNIKPEDIVYTADSVGYTNPPPDLNVTTNLGDYPADTTIDGSKYRDLTRLAFVTQLIYPILNQLLDHVSFITGKGYRDAVVGDLVSQLTQISGQPGYRILDTYLRVSCQRQESKRNTTAISSEIKYIDHAVYKGLFNKLCLTFIPSRIKGKNLSNELNSLVKGEARTETNAKFKSFKDNKPTGDDISIQESYNISQEVNATDELAQAEYFTFDLFVESEPGVFIKKDSDFFKYQCLGLGIKNQHMAEKIFNTLPANCGFELTDAHIGIVQLVFQNDIEYRIYEAMDYDQLMAALSLAQTKLFELGFEHLAVCILAVKNNAVPKMFTDDTYKLNTREREKLVSICSDYVGQQTGTTDNSAVIAVSNILDCLASCGWESNIEIGLLENETYVNLMSPSHRYPVEVTSQIKLELLALINMNNSIE